MLRFVDLVEAVGLHQFVDREHAAAVPLDQFRDEVGRVGVTFDHAAHRLTVEEARGGERDVAHHHADDDETPRRPQCINRAADDRGYAGGVEPVLRTSTGDRPYLGGDVGSGLRIDDVRRTHFLGEREAVVVKVDRDDRRATGDLRGHDTRQAHGTCSVDHDRRTRACGKRVEHGPCAGLETATERPEDLQLHVVGRHLHDVALIRHRVRREARLTEPAAAHLPAVGRAERRGSVEARAHEVESAEQFAVLRQAGLAVVAATATRVRQDDLVAGGDFRHSLTDTLDDPRSLVAEHDGHREGCTGNAREKVGVAHAGTDDAHENFTRPRVTDLEFLDLERSIVRRQNSGGDFHVGILSFLVSCWQEVHP